MVTTIQVSTDLKKALEKQKFTKKETYEEIIWDLLEDRAELSKQTKHNLKEAEKEIEQGQTISLSALKEKYGIQ